MKTKRQPRPVGLFVLMVCVLFLGLGGLAGGAGMLADPSGQGMQLPPSLLKALPVSDYTLPGVFLFVVLGVFPVIVFYGLLMRPRWAWTDAITRWTGRHWSWLAALLLSIILIVWIVVETIFLGYMFVLQPLFGALGLLMLALAWLPGVRSYYRDQEVAP